MNKKTITIYAILSITSGCAKTVTTNITIEQNEKPTLLTAQEFNGTQLLNYSITEYDINKDIEFFNGNLSDYYYTNITQSTKKYIEFILQKKVVTGSEHPYIIKISITSDKEIKPKKNSGNDRLFIERCTHKNYIEEVGGTSLFIGSNYELINDTYHYNLYTAYNIAASEMLLNNISDLCISYYDDSMPGQNNYTDTRYVTKTNTLTIPAQDFKDALDYWSIPYDL